MFSTRSAISMTRQLAHSFTVRRMTGLPKFHKLMETAHGTREAQFKDLADSVNSSIGSSISGNVETSVDAVLKIMEKAAKRIEEKDYENDVMITGEFNLGTIKITISTEV